jgi:hypothetical protein
MAVIVIERSAPAGERETRQFAPIDEASFPPEQCILTEGHGLGADTPFVRELVPGLG